eukprot:1832756-Pleurochrysis_carterae.AAC.1
MRIDLRYCLLEPSAMAREVASSRNTIRLHTSADRLAFVKLGCEVASATISQSISAKTSSTSGLMVLARGTKSGGGT